MTGLRLVWSCGGILSSFSFPRRRFHDSNAPFHIDYMAICPWQERPQRFFPFFEALEGEIVYLMFG